MDDYNNLVDENNKLKDENDKLKQLLDNLKSSKKDQAKNYVTERRMKPSDESLEAELKAEQDWILDVYDN